MQKLDPNTYRFALIIGAIIVGVVCGLAPLITGFIKKRVGLGVIGFVVSMVGGVLLGILLALPVAVIFTLIIMLKKTASNTFTAPPSPPTFDN